MKVSKMGEGPLVRFTRIRHPVAREEDLLVEDLADETVVYDNRTKQAHCLSPLAAIVFAHCDGRTTVDQLSALATEGLGEPVDEPRVIDALAQLQERDLLAVPPRDGLSRRQMIGKSAAAGGALVGASLITTILAPTAAATSSQFCEGQSLCRGCNGSISQPGGCCVINTGLPGANGPCPNGGPGGVDGPPCCCSQQGGGANSCCVGKGCNCTAGTNTATPHCKPANDNAVTCQNDPYTAANCFTQT